MIPSSKLPRHLKTRIPLAMPPAPVDTSPPKIEIRKLNFGRQDSPVPELLRRVLREARVVAAVERRHEGCQSTGKTPSDLERRGTAC